MRLLSLLALLLLIAGPALAQDAAQPASATGAPAPVIDSEGGATLLLLAFALLILVPFVPGLMEVYWPRDRYPLPLNTEYVKDPRYLGRSARRLLREALGGLADEPGRHEVHLSREERVDVSVDLELARGSVTAPLQYASGAFTARERAECERDVHCRGDARVERAAILRALACDGDAVLDERARIVRWIDVEGDLRVGREASLGAHACASGRLELSDGVRFTRLTGAPVCTTGWSGDAEFGPARALLDGVDLDDVDDVTDVVHREKNDFDLEPGADPGRHLVVLGDLRVKAGAVLRGSAKVHGEAVLEPGAVILGDLFAEGAVTLEDGARVGGNVFSQDAIRLGPGSRVGAAGGTKSVVARRDVTLTGDVAVHGHVATSGEGRVRCPGSA